MWKIRRHHESPNIVETSATSQGLAIDSLFPPSLVLFFLFSISEEFLSVNEYMGSL